MNPLHSMPYPANPINEFNNSHPTQNQREKNREKEGRRTTMADEDKSFWRRWRRQPSASKKLHSSWILYVLLYHSMIIHNSVTKINLNIITRTKKPEQNMRGQEKTCRRFKTLPPDIQTPYSCKEKIYVNDFKLSQQTWPLTMFSVIDHSCMKTPKQEEDQRNMIAS